MPNKMRSKINIHGLKGCFRCLSLLLFLLTALPTAAQKYPERSLVRKGNRAFEKQKFERSIDHYREAMEQTPGTWEAGYNLGNALYRTEQYDKAAESLRRAATDSLRTAEERAEAYYNLADVQYKQQKLPEALESLKSSLRLNPNDEDAKFNYTLVKRQMQEQQQEEQEQQQEQNQEQQEQQENTPEQDAPNPEQQPQPEQQQGETQAESPSISDQELEQMLEAIQAQEDETQEKLKEKKAVLVKGGKNW